MNKDKKIRSLKWKFAKIMLLCWVLPFLVIIGLVGFYMLITQRENQMERLAAQAGAEYPDLRRAPERGHRRLPPGYL